MRGVFISLLLAVLGLPAGLAGAWYAGVLAPFYVTYPERPPLETRRPNLDIKVIAHRGAELVAPESTLPAFEAAFDLGADYVEVDIRLTADGIPVVMHDANVRRTTDGEGQIERLTFAELQEFDAGSWFAPEYTGVRIPRAEDVLQAAKGRSCVMADLKAVPNRALIRMLQDFAEGQEPGCLLIAIYGISDLNTFPVDKLSPDEVAQLQKVVDYRTSMSFQQMRVFNRYWPAFPRVGALRADGTVAELLDEYPGLAVVELSVHLSTPENVEALHAAGVLAYTRVSSQQEKNFSKTYPVLIEAGIDLLLISDLVRLWDFVADYPQPIQQPATDKSGDLPTGA